MKRVLPLFLAAAVSLTSGEILLEGVVKLPPGKSGRVGVSRYQLRTTGSGATPAAPMAVVYLEGTFPSSNATNTPPSAQMGQKNLQFTPILLPVQKGTRVEFPNLDDEYHNVLSYSKAKELDLGRYRKNEKPPSVVFEKPGVVELGCEIHEHMQGTILVLETPYFATTDANGRYRLGNLPAGKFVLKVWVNERTTLQQPVELKEGSTLQLDFTGP